MGGRQGEMKKQEAINCIDDVMNEVHSNVTHAMLTYNVGFINTDGEQDETLLDIEERNSTDKEVIELMNLILSLKDEMDIKEVTYIYYLECEDNEG